MVMNERGVWVTDCTANRREAMERAKFLMSRVPAVRVDDSAGHKVYLEGA